MRNIKNAPSKRIRPTAGIFILVAMLTGAAAASLAQEQSYPPKKPVTTEISSRLFVLADAAVEEQWKASLDLVIAEVLRELDRLGVKHHRREHPEELGIWWAGVENMETVPA